MEYKDAINLIKRNTKGGICRLKRSQIAEIRRVKQESGHYILQFDKDFKMYTCIDGKDIIFKERF